MMLLHMMPLSLFLLLLLVLVLMLVLMLMLMLMMFLLMEMKAACTYDHVDMTAMRVNEIVAVAATVA
jgi:hypothetical protein